MYVISPSSSFALFLENLRFLSTLQKVSPEQHIGTREDSLLIDLRHDLVDSFLGRLVIAIYKSVSISV